MLSRATSTQLICIGIALWSAGTAYAQDYPNRPVRIITSGAGGSSDIIARLVAQGISGLLGQQVIVENRPTGVIPGQTVAAAAPDGYTLLVSGGTLWTSTLLRKTSYDAIRDFAPITLIENSVSVIAVHPSLPVKSVKDLIALARARPGELNYTSSGAGSTSHLTMELFKSMANVDIVHVPYKSNSAAMMDLLGGQVQLSFISASSVVPQVKAGKLRALAVSSAAPSALMPGLPTVAASGVPGYEAVSMTALLAPAKTPAPVIRRANEEAVRYLRTPEAKETLLKNGAEAVGSTPEQLATAIKSDMERLGKLIKDLNLRVD